MRDKSTVYHGTRTPNGCIVEVNDPDNNWLERLNPRFDIARHSPTGFEWGYPGSGPAQLALALLCDALGDDERARRHYQRFKVGVVAVIREREFSMTADKIRQLVELYEGGDAR